MPTEKSAPATAERQRSGWTGGPVSDLQRKPSTTSPQDTVQATKDAAQRTGTGRKSLATRLQEKRGSQPVEKNRQAGAVSPDSTAGVRTQAQVRDRMGDRRTGTVASPTRSRAALDPQTQMANAETRRRSLSSRMTEHVQRQDRMYADRAGGRMDSNIAARTIRTEHLGVRPTYLHAWYRDRPDLISYRPHHIYSYYDYHDRLCHRVVWPGFYFSIGYQFGPHIYYHDIYPYYHRKYVFISLGGYWPGDYYYTRYYWYGYHPYVWYGYYPVAREVATGQYNYYTYNYYNDDGTLSTSYTTDNPPQYADQNTFADVRARLEQQKTAQPAPQTLADTRFEEGVKSFESGDYAVAAEKFANAAELSPEDMILPFAYAQALFADGQYTKSAAVIREALKKVSPEKEGVFYPRGLYANDDVLFQQIQGMLDKLDQSGHDADLQLLLGYHLLGVGETGYARDALERASQDPQNAQSAAVLLKLVDKVESEAAAAKVTPQDAGASNAQVASPSATPAPAVTAPSVGATAATADANVPNVQKTPADAPVKAPAESPIVTPAPGPAGGQPANKEEPNAL